MFVLVAGVVVLGATVFSHGGYGNGYGPGMMGGGITAQGQAGATTSPSEASRLGQSAPSGASVDPSANKVTFSGASVDLTVLAAPSDGLDETFRVAGLTNPTIVVPEGVKVTLTLINADAGMAHNWLLTAAQPPFAAYLMMTGVAMNAATQTLPETTSSVMPETTITFTASAAGNYTYLCSVPGHAQKGMDGSFEVL